MKSVVPHSSRLSLLAVTILRSCKADKRKLAVKFRRCVVVMSRAAHLGMYCWKILKVRALQGESKSHPTKQLHATGWVSRDNRQLCCTQKAQRGRGPAVKNNVHGLWFVVGVDLQVAAKNPLNYEEYVIGSYPKEKNTSSNFYYLCA